ncbi:MAG TPA: cytochrome c3 family protein [Chloroflexota bacterium]
MPTFTATPLPSATATLTVTPTFTVTPTVTPTLIPLAVTFDRSLSGDRVGEHKVPPLSRITMTLTATLSASVAQGELVDYFPSEWGIADAAGGTVTDAGSNTSKISWKVDTTTTTAGGPGTAADSLLLDQTVSRSYVLISPPLTTPPTDYHFVTELLYPGGAVYANPYRVTVADAPSVQYLHAAQVTVGSTTYNTVNTTALAGTQATSSVNFSTTGTFTAADSGGHTIFASDAVPSGQSWNLTGTWNFTMWAQAISGTGTGTIQAAIYRISSTGSATLVTTATSTANALASTTYTSLSWSYAVPTFTLNSGERFGVAIQVNVTSRGSATGFRVAYDISSYNSSITPQVQMRLHEAHYRIGQDTGLPPSAWYSALDTAATGLQRGVNFRVRFQMYNNTGTSQSWTPRLEWATATTGPWTAVPITSNTNPFFVASSSAFSNGAQITANALGTGTGTWTSGFAYDTQNPGNAQSLGGSNYTEFEFNVQANANAAYGTQYYFRLSDNGLDIGSYANFAQVSLAAPTVREAHYRIGQDSPLTAMTWYASTDTPATGFSIGANFRVRFQMYNNVSSVSNWTPQLEWGTTTTGPWAAVPSSSGTNPFFVASTSQFTNGAAIPAANFGLGTGTGTAQQGVAYDTQNPGAVFALNANSYSELEFSVQANSNVVYNTPYYFRFTDGGSALTSYVNYAQVTIIPPSPAHGDVGGYNATTDACAKCHRTHDASVVSLTTTKSALSGTQENVCLTCHDGTGASTNIKAEFAYTYEHPIAANDLHRFGENTPAKFSGTNRHVECVDCHEPHSAIRGNHSPGSSNAAQNLTGQSGIGVTNGAGWTVPTYTFLGSVTSEYQLCMKCHSSWAYGSTPPTSHTGGITETNQALEFNVNNGNYHWVEGDQTASSGATPRTNDGRNLAFVNGWTRNSKMTCSDCHASQSDTDPRGAHGSSNAYMLRGPWTTTTGKTGTSNDLCFKCHDYNTYGQGGTGAATTTMFTDGSQNLHVQHWGFQSTLSCQSCHSGVPHGGNQTYTISGAARTLPAMLAPIAYGTADTRVSDPPYNTNSVLSIRTWKTGTNGNWSQNDCAFLSGGTFGH